MIDALYRTRCFFPKEGKNEKESFYVIDRSYVIRTGSLRRIFIQQRSSIFHSIQCSSIFCS